MTTPTYRVLSILFGLGLGWLPIADAATVEVGVDTGLFPTGSAGPGQETQTDGDIASVGFVTRGVSGAASGNGLSRVSSATASSSATAGFGLLKIAANVSAANNFNTTPAQAGAVSYARYADELMFVAPVAALTGTRGTATLNWVVTGISGLSACATCVGQTDWSVGTSMAGNVRILGSGTDTLVREYRGVNAGPPIGGFPTSPLSVSIEFTFGELLTLGQEARANPSVSALSTDSPGPVVTADGAINLGSTIRWLGVTNLQDFQGNVIGCTVSSSSGTDWCSAVSAPVPIPASVWLLGTALAAMRAWRGRSRLGGNANKHFAGVRARPLLFQCAA
jgi:hypothetical protein